MKIFLNIKYLFIAYWPKGEWTVVKMPHSITFNLGRLQLVLYKIK
jgi:hypothetical protein